LAYEDRTLKEYYVSRFLYVYQKHYELLFNKICESGVSIIKMMGKSPWEKEKNRGRSKPPSMEEQSEYG
jgi:hypothetical protein